MQRLSALIMSSFALCLSDFQDLEEVCEPVNGTHTVEELRELLSERMMSPVSEGGGEVLLECGGVKGKVCMLSRDVSRVLIV